LRTSKFGEKVRTAIDLQTYLTADEAATVLRTTRKAIYALIERRQLAGVIRLGRRVLIHRETLLQSLHQQCASSLQE
jgi:excisionase family DNA binding protein